MLKLCIVCNSKVPSSNKACSCGHVFAPESQRIGGKRFSGYRVGTTRRQSTALSERQPNAAKTDLSPKRKKALLFTTSPLSNGKHLQQRRLSNVKKKSKQIGKPRRIGVLQENCPIKSDRYRQLKATPQKTLRFALALAEINRRLCGQTLLWRTLTP